MKTPWHLWAVGALTLLFNAGGAVDYVMTQTQNADYLAQFSAEELAYFQSFPSWIEGTWALAVWGAVLGSVLILLRSKWVVGVYAVSVISMAITFIHKFLLAEVKMHDVVGAEAIWFSAFIALITVATFLYARIMAGRGVLR